MAYENFFFFPGRMWFLNVVGRGGHPRIAVVLVPAQRARHFTIKTYDKKNKKKKENRTGGKGGQKYEKIKNKNQRTISG